jgi:tetratricopeptide (TPR) repeat protein
VHDRYLYLASYPFCALLAWCIMKSGKPHDYTRVALGLGVASLFLVSSWHELQYWECDRTLWTRVVEISPSHIGGIAEVAGYYYQDGDLPRALAKIDEGLRYHPNSSGLWLTRANFLLAEKRLDEARIDYQHVLRSTAPGDEPLTGTLLRSRYTAVYQMARLEIEAGNYKAAEDYARMALTLNPAGSGYHSTLAAALQGQGRDPEARAENMSELRLALARRTSETQPSNQTK